MLAYIASEIIGAILSINILTHNPVLLILSYNKVIIEIRKLTVLS